MVGLLLGFCGMANCALCGRKLPALTLGRKICAWCVRHEAAQRGEPDEDLPQPVMAVPWTRQESSATVTKFLFGANLAVFVAMVAASRSIDPFPGPILAAFGANYGPLTLTREWWRLLTYMFVHADIWHIGFNMWCLWSFGGLCESLYGNWTFGALYLISGVTGGLASVAWHPMAPSVGASGAIFGLAGALIASLYLGEFSIPSDMIQANLKSLLFFVGFNVLFGISPIGDMFGIHVDNACHIGGLAGGLILGALIARLAPQEDARRVGILVVVALAVAASAFGVQRWRGGQLNFSGSMMARQQNIENAIAALQKKIQKNPQDVASHYALARAFFADGQIAEGTTELKRVLDLDPQNAKARMDLGAAYLTQKQLKEAQQEFSTLVGQQPDNAGAHAGLGVALAEQENYAGSVPEYEAAARLNPQIAGIYYRLGVSQFQLKQYDDAVSSFLKERDTNGDDPELESALADAYQAKGMTKEAEAARAQAAQLQQRQ
jgi:membrane associated rhomboid family serine protease/Flp pilus assembly protein TadD